MIWDSSCSRLAAQVGLIQSIKNIKESVAVFFGKKFLIRDKSFSYFFRIETPLQKIFFFSIARDLLNTINDYSLFNEFDKHIGSKLFACFQVINWMGCGKGQASVDKKEYLGISQI